MIDRATIDRILDAAQIYEVVSDFITLRKRGVNYVGLCPFHEDTTPSFYVSPAKGLCKCFACGKGGNAVHFIMEHEQMSYYEALRYLAKKYGIEVKERELSREEKIAQSERESLFLINQFARDHFCSTLHNHPEGRNVGMAYLRNRGFRDDIIERFQLGYCLESKHALADEALQKGYKRDYLLKTGLCYEREDHSLTDRFWGRVIFPVHTLSGKVVAFGGRVLAKGTKGIKVKYVNSPESEIYHKSNELYGIYFAKQAIVKHDRCYLVEGYTDVISMYQSGVENVVASSGTALTHGQIRMIHRFTSNMTILYDGDEAGIKASLRGIDLLLEEGMNIKVCLLPDGDDPDSFARKHSAEDFRNYIAEHETDFIRFKTRLLKDEMGRDPQQRVELISSVVQSISVIPDAIARDVYIHDCSQMLEVNDKLLVQEVAVRRERKAELDAERRERERAARARGLQTGYPSQTSAGEAPISSGTTSSGLASRGTTSEGTTFANGAPAEFAPVSGDMASGGTTSGGTTSGSTTFANGAPAEFAPVSGDMASGGTTSGGATSGNITSGGMPSWETTSDAVSLGNEASVSDSMIPGNEAPISSDMASGETTSGGGAPAAEFAPVSKDMAAQVTNSGDMISGGLASGGMTSGGLTSGGMASGGLTSDAVFSRNESFIPASVGDQTEFFIYERQLIQVVVRYGEQIMLIETDEETGEERPVSVIDYIASELHQDELQFHNLLHRRILAEAEEHAHEEGFVCRRYFLAHPDEMISKLSADLISDRYQLSKYHSKAQRILSDEERLADLVPQLMMSFKLAIVSEELKHLVRALQDPALAKDPERCNQLMSRCNEMMKLQVILAKNSGERIVLS